MKAPAVFVSLESDLKKNDYGGLDQGATAVQGCLNAGGVE
jgi:hypothetical protein